MEVERVRDELSERLACAERVLASLEAAREETERVLAESQRSDPMKAVTGRSALESSIETTRGLVEVLRRAVGDAQRVLSSGGSVNVEVVAGLRVALAR